MAEPESTRHLALQFLSEKFGPWLVLCFVLGGLGFGLKIISDDVLAPMVKHWIDSDVRVQTELYARLDTMNQRLTVLGASCRQPAGTADGN